MINDNLSSVTQEEKEKYLELYNQSLQKPIDEIQNNLIEIYKRLFKQLSLDHIGFDINYRNNRYNFFPPTTPKEQKKMDREKKSFIKRLLKDELRRSVDIIANGYAYGCGGIVSFDNEYLSSYDPITSEDVSEVYDVPGETTDTKEKPLDMDSIHMFSQRMDMTPEKWQELFTKKFGDTIIGESAKEIFELSSRRDNLPDENSNS